MKINKLNFIEIEFYFLFFGYFELIFCSSSRSSLILCRILVISCLCCYDIIAEEKMWNKKIKTKIAVFLSLTKIFSFS